MKGRLVENEDRDQGRCLTVYSCVKDFLALLEEHTREGQDGESREQRSN